MAGDWETSAPHIVISSEERNLCRSRSDGQCLELPNGKPAPRRLSGIALFILRGAFRHPERSDMSDVRKCKGGTVRTESKDLALYHHFSFLISHSHEAFKLNQRTVRLTG